MKIATTLLILFCACYSISAQDEKIYGYYSSLWFEATKETAVYYRTVEKLKGRNYVIRSYYMSGQKQMDSIICSDYKPELKFEADLSVYHENGSVKQHGSFKNEKPYGLHKFWYPNGQFQKEVLYNEKNEPHMQQFFSSNGTQLVKDGTGVSVEETPFEEKYFIQWDRSITIKSYTLENSDTVYTVVDQQAELEGGFPALLKALNQNLKIPSSERYKKVDGKVFVRFMVDEVGRTHYHYVIKGISKPFNEEAVRVCKLLQSWNPGIYQGKKVKSWFVLPIYFKIDI